MWFKPFSLTPVIAHISALVSLESLSIHCFDGATWNIYVPHTEEPGIRHHTSCHSSTLLQDSWESCTRDSLSGLGHSCAIITLSVISADPCTAIHLALFFFGGDHTSWLVASLFHDQGLNSGPQQWNCIVLTIGLPNNWHWTLALDCQRISSLSIIL